MCTGVAHIMCCKQCGAAVEKRRDVCRGYTCREARRVKRRGICSTGIEFAWYRVMSEEMCLWCELRAEILAIDAFTCDPAADQWEEDRKLEEAELFDETMLGDGLAELVSVGESDSEDFASCEDWASQTEIVTGSESEQESWKDAEEFETDSSDDEEEGGAKTRRGSRLKRVTRKERCGVTRCVV
ncbi:hypothetical protein GGR57DRAFT_465814 [Xylariaceae sp. FL1272]|nr:hypothetical protein GGR57DRAFT_465814 [Xylariaceae sp. FL1272]